MSKGIRRTQCANRAVTGIGFTGLTIKTKPDVAITLHRFIAERGTWNARVRRDSVRATRMRNEGY